MDLSLNHGDKKIAKVLPLHLKESGYGPDGRQTREDWQKECRVNLLAGRQVFEDWQKSLEAKIDKTLPKKSFAYELVFDDGSKSVAFEQFQILSFCYPLDFVGQVFNDDVDFRIYPFLQPALFSAVIFRGVANFSHANFKYESNFSDSAFCKYLHFDNSSFQDYAYFQKTIFLDIADYQKVIFEKKAFFSEAIFLANTFFSSAHFKGDAIFNSVTFASRVFFRQASFHEQCRFDNNFDSTNKKWFKKTTFTNTAEFENAIFNNIGHFERVNFFKHFPAFRGCKIDATRIEFSEETTFPKTVFSTETIKDVSFLKRISDEHGQTDQALRFNAIELQLKRLSPNTDIGFKIVTWSYEQLSDYGRSFAKPIFWYAVLICLSALFAMAYSTYSESPAKEKRILCNSTNEQPLLKLDYGRAVVEYAMFRAGGLMDFTDTGKQNNAVNCRLFEEPIEPPLMRAWGIFKGIASIALLFLAALGLRNKYRIK